MLLVEELADNLAKDAIELANQLGNDDVICEAAKVLVAINLRWKRPTGHQFACVWPNDARAVFLRKRHKEPKRGSLCHLSQ